MEFLEITVEEYLVVKQEYFVLEVKGEYELSSAPVTSNSAMKEGLHTMLTIDAIHVAVCH